MAAGGCGYSGCGDLAVVDVTIKDHLATPPVVWCLCQRHGRSLVDLLNGRVYWLGVEHHGVHQGVLDI